jgi:hypothetical protein
LLTPRSKNLRGLDKSMADESDRRLANSEKMLSDYRSSWQAVPA